MGTECSNLKQAKGKAYIATLSDESKKKEESSENCLTLVAPHENQDDLYYSEHGDRELKEILSHVHGTHEAERVQSEESDKAKHNEDRKRHITSEDHIIGR
jgi:hypothetical protein